MSAEVRRPVLRYHGGKFRLAPELLRIFPPHRVYTEVFRRHGDAARIQSVEEAGDVQ